MADEIPPAPSETDDASKAETIRITLPPKQEQQQSIKRETVRINLPGRPLPPAGISPKKETTKISTVAPPAAAAMPAAPAGLSAPAAPVGLSKPTLPAMKPAGLPARPGLPTGSAPGMPAAPAPGSPSAPPFAPGLPPAKPLSGPPGPPKPPGMAPRPTVPLKPTPPPGAAPSAPTMGGVTPSPMPIAGKATAAPKKETARITLPPEGAGKAQLPKATVKMGQTQPLVSRPQAALVAPAIKKNQDDLVAAGDGTPAWMGIAALVASLAAFALVFMVFSAAGV